jgi:hypothetical protein
MTLKNKKKATIDSLRSFSRGRIKLKKEEFQA